MKVSQIQESDIASYLRLDQESDELLYFLDTAKEFIRGYTGLDDEEMDEHEDFYIVVMILCQDMYDNRRMYVDTKNLNQVVSTILDMHRINLL